jgi:hypothetical protein
VRYPTQAARQKDRRPGPAPVVPGGVAVSRRPASAVARYGRGRSGGTRTRPRPTPAVDTASAPGGRRSARRFAACGPWRSMLSGARPASQRDPPAPARPCRPPRAVAPPGAGRDALDRHDRPTAPQRVIPRAPALAAHVAEQALGPSIRAAHHPAHIWWLNPLTPPDSGEIATLSATCYSASRRL